MHDPWTVDRDLRLVLAIDRVEMRRQMIVELHPHDDPEETRDLRHLATVRGEAYPAITSCSSIVCLVETATAATTASPASQPPTTSLG